MVAKKKSLTHRGKNQNTAGAKKMSKKTAAPSHSKTVATIDRREKSDRRASLDRRQKSVPVAVERRSMERRVKVNRRRQIDPTTCERDYTPEEIEFMGAMDNYKRRSGRMFPTCSEVLEVIKSLGYIKAPSIEMSEMPDSAIVATPTTVA